MNTSVSRNATSGMWGEVEITAGNIKNSHFYMRKFINRFPPDIIGGSSDSKQASQKAVIDWGGPATVETDIDGEDKKFFRKRGWVREFFAKNGAAAGDVVRVEETAPYHYKVTLRKAGTPA